MVEELVDIVDEHDQPVGQTATKKQAHDQKLIHRIAAVLVFKPNGKLLVQKHKVWGRRLDHSVGGHVSAGEDYHTAAKREMEEELGLTLPLLHLAYVQPGLKYFNELDKTTRHNYGIYTAQAPADFVFQPNDEVDQVFEMEIADIVELMNKKPRECINGFMISLSAYLRQIDSPLKVTAYNIKWDEL